MPLIKGFQAVHAFSIPAQPGSADRFRRLPAGAAAMGDPAATVARPPPHGFIEGDDREGMIRLQREIEGGRRVIIPAPPERTGAGVRVPIHYLD